MAAEVKKEIQLEIAHVLFTDIVGYSKLPINQQRALVERLNEIVRGTDEFQAAERAGRLITIPTGDGITLVFYDSPETPTECALEISRALKKHPELQLRMGIHSGPVSGVIDATGKANVAGAGINIAQRVMDCGDAGHILLSKHVAEDLEEYPHWQPHLHELGECEVKHGAHVSVVNLHTGELGNPAVPEKLKAAAARRKRAAFRWLSLGVVSLLAVIAVIGFFLFRYTRPLATVGLPVPEKSIAVLPFDNLSADPENAFFTDGVQDEILNDLARIADLKVISRTSVMQYKSVVKRNVREIASELGVAHVVEGSVQRAANRVRVTAQLIDARTDTHLWVERYDRPLNDVFAIQSDIAKEIADQLQAKLSPNEKSAIEERPTKDLAAYDLYVRAKSLMLKGLINPGNLVEPARLLDQAIARDPDFFLAYCLLAEAHSHLYSIYDHTPTRRDLADRAVKAALNLRPEAGEAHLERARYLFRCNLDYDNARAELVIAQRSLPNNAQAFALLSDIDVFQGRWNESVRNLKKALELDPRNAFSLRKLALNYAFMRRYAEAAVAVDRAIALAPEDAGLRVYRAWFDLAWRADPTPLHKIAETMMNEGSPVAAEAGEFWLDLALCERDPVLAERALVTIGDGFTQQQLSFSITFLRGSVARAFGDDAAARNAFTAARAEVERTVRERPDEGPPLCVLGLIDAGLGRKEEALREGRRASELTPVTKDAFNGAHIMCYLGVIYAWTGEKDLAIEQIAATLQVPSFLSYGELRLHPFWDPLRGDPRFEKIVASLAPQ
jgi:TolB-like protein/class 3 adenylate cyclase/Flp pilus assembly protein TadD